MKSFDLVMVNMSTLAEWDMGRRNRNYFLAQAWEKHPAVRSIVHVDFFPVSWKYLIRDLARTRIFPRQGKVIHRTPLTIVRKRHAKLYHCSTVASVVRPNHLASELARAVQKTGVKNPVLWITNPLHVEMIGCLDESLVIFDAVDNWMRHQNFQMQREVLRQNYRAIAESANIIFGVSQNLLDELFPNHPRARWIPNGVDCALFSPLIPLDSHIEKLPRPRIGYAGVIEERFDADLVCGLAERNPTYSFIIAGMIWNSEIRKKLRTGKNIALLDQYIPGPRFSSVMNTFDVVIIPHRINSFTRGMNPMKMYEALALGKPIVSTRIQGVEMFPDLVRVADSPEAFTQMLHEELQADSPERRQVRVVRAQEHSWTSRIRRIEQLMSEFLS